MQESVCKRVDVIPKQIGRTTLQRNFECRFMIISRPLSPFWTNYIVVKLTLHVMGQLLVSFCISHADFQSDHLYSVALFRLKWGLSVLQIPNHVHNHYWYMVWLCRPDKWNITMRNGAHLRIHIAFHTTFRNMQRPGTIALCIVIAYVCISYRLCRVIAHMLHVCESRPLDVSEAEN